MLFNDCNTVRDDINKIEGLSGNTLINLINTYNNCEYSTYLPTETEIKKANTYNTDTFRFYTNRKTGYGIDPSGLGALSRN